MHFSFRQTLRPLPFTSSPFLLAIADLLLFVRITFLIWPPWLGLPTIVYPFLPYRSGKLDELYPSLANLWALTIQLLLTAVQAIFVLFWIPGAFIGLPFSYTPVYFFSIFAFWLINRWVCRFLLNGYWRSGHSRNFNSQIDLVTKFPGWKAEDYSNEKWMFINGVAAGSTWMQSNLDRLALTFRRPIEGIHNETRGILFDVFECIFQRTLGYATPDIREIYLRISQTLKETNSDGSGRYKKIVLILHSQGAIEGGFVLDWLFATMPGNMMERIEVYTFGSAANHFNSPLACKILVNSKGQVINPSSASRNGNGKYNSISMDSKSEIDPKERVIKYIEHYANSDDYVSRFGILHFRPLPVRTDILDNLLDLQSPSTKQDQSDVENRYVGRLFVRKAKGHQMNGNYLDDYFTMDKELTEVQDSNSYMDGEVNEELLDEYDIVAIVDESGIWDTESSKGSKIEDDAKSLLKSSDSETKKDSASKTKRPKTLKQRKSNSSSVQVATANKKSRMVKDVSRLWRYRNGGSPSD